MQKAVDEDLTPAEQVNRVVLAFKFCLIEHPKFEDIATVTKRDGSKFVDVLLRHHPKLGVKQIAKSSNDSAFPIKEFRDLVKGCGGRMGQIRPYKSSRDTILKKEVPLVLVARVHFDVP